MKYLALIVFAACQPSASVFAQAACQKGLQCGIVGGHQLQACGRCVDAFLDSDKDIREAVTKQVDIDCLALLVLATAAGIVACVEGEKP